MTDRDEIADVERKLAHAERELTGWQRNKNGRANEAMCQKYVDTLRAERAKLLLLRQREV